jgi:acyl transferase domain-containing protein
MSRNGRSDGISHPSVDGQEAVIRQAYYNAGGLDPSLTGYFEAHGTGTPVGDPLEVNAIGRVFSEYRQEDPLLIGSIKPNLGHSESASAIASIMKAVLAIEKGQIPPTRGITKFNPAIDFDRTRTKVVTDVTPWPQRPIRRASVNSFGYGGANGESLPRNT